MSRTIEEFKKQVKEKGITRWDVHDCSMCGYACGFIFENEKVSYDAGCNCIMKPPRPSSWDEVAKYYNSQVDWASNPGNKKKKLTKKNIKKMDKLWGFK